MRFLSGGPSIPEELLQASDQWDVIFLCGAGVSRPAGFPGFADLARQVIEKLGTPADAASRQLLERILGDSQATVSLDQVFQNLKYEYGADEIDDVVSALLDPGTGAGVEHHALLLKLSRSAAGRPQIVTTNFDLLFERADPSLAATTRHEMPQAFSETVTGQSIDHGMRGSFVDDTISTPLNLQCCPSRELREGSARQLLSVCSLEFQALPHGSRCQRDAA